MANHHYLRSSVRVLYPVILDSHLYSPFSKGIQNYFDPVKQ